MQSYERGCVKLAEVKQVSNKDKWWWLRDISSGSELVCGEQQNSNTLVLKMDLGAHNFIILKPVLLSRTACCDG